MKGQAAMEYLMTYGWALLAILIVIGALLLLNPFKLPETCTFQQPGLLCSDPPPTATADADKVVHISARVWNKLGRTIEVNRILCTTSQGGGIKKEHADPVSVQISNGDYKDFINIVCKDSSGNDVTGSLNQQFKGSLVLWYQYEEDIANVDREAIATVVSTVSSSSQ
ncbi:MAG: hypothetical protein QW035_00760 [Candidatus Anstonellales archaeon]